MTKCLVRHQARITRAVVVEAPRTGQWVRTIAVCSARGGVGKTTIAARLARALGAGGKRSVLVDLDPRGCATKALTPPACYQHARPGGIATGPEVGALGLNGVRSVGLEALGPIRGVSVEDRVCRLVAGLAGEAAAVVLDCPPESPGRVGPFTGAALAAARAGGPGSGVIAVMSPAAPDPAGTAELLARGGPEAVLGLVVNGVRDSGIEASHHDVARCMGAPVLARVPAVEHPEAPGVVDDAIGVLARVLTSGPGLTEAWAEVQASAGESARRDAELGRLLERELARLEVDPDLELDPEFELGLELLRRGDSRPRLLRAAPGPGSAARPRAGLRRRACGTPT
jgi:CobQ/CobB/MinD/ParA family nucleotide binding protein